MSFREVRKNHVPTAPGLLDFLRVQKAVKKIAAVPKKPAAKRKPPLTNQRTMTMTTTSKALAKAIPSKLKRPGVTVTMTKAAAKQIVRSTKKPVKRRIK